jgi:hypothetical protein
MRALVPGLRPIYTTREEAVYQLMMPEMASSSGVGWSVTMDGDLVKLSEGATFASITYEPGIFMGIVGVLKHRAGLRRPYSFAIHDKPVEIIVEGNSKKIKFGGSIPITVDYQDFITKVVDEPRRVVKTVVVPKDMDFERA